MNRKLPKILFIGAITFEEVSGSHSFFYRLFTEYPPEQLMVIGSHRSRNPIFPPKTLPGVNYIIIEEQLGLKEIKPATKKWSSIFRFYVQSLKQILKTYFLIRTVTKSFKPDIILTLTMNYHWYLAYRASKYLNIPLELVLHDLWEPNTEEKIAICLSTQFKRVFKYARHRFCISPSMEQYYYQKLGIHGDVLYPMSRKKIFNHFSIGDKKSLNLVYFGNIWDHIPTLIDLAHLLYEKDIQLVIFSNRDLSFFQNHGLNTPNVTANLFFQEHDDLLSWCQENADIFYLPMCFDDSPKGALQCSFPSKMADYTAFGLPLIIHAPRSSSVIKFAESNRTYQFAELVTSQAKHELASAIDRLTNLEYREKLGRNSLHIWHKFFDPEVARESFLKKLI